MSWGLSITADARADLKSMDVWLQEEVLDELDQLASDPPRPRPGAGSEIIHDFDRTSGNLRHIVFLRCLRNEAAMTLVVLRIADCPMSPPRA